MRRSWIVFILIITVLGVVLGGLQLGSHKNAIEPAVKTELTLPSDVVIGTCLIKAGTYVVACDKEIVSFTLKLTNEKVLTVPCDGPMMKEPAKETRAVYEMQPSGYLVMEKLYLKGNNVEHIF